MADALKLLRVSISCDIKAAFHICSRTVLLILKLLLLNSEQHSKIHISTYLFMYFKVVYNSVQVIISCRNVSQVGKWSCDRIGCQAAERCDLNTDRSLDPLEHLTHRPVKTLSFFITTLTDSLAGATAKICFIKHQ